MRESPSSESSLATSELLHSEGDLAGDRWIDRVVQRKRVGLSVEGKHPRIALAALESAERDGEEDLRVGFMNSVYSSSASDKPLASEESSRGSDSSSESTRSHASSVVSERASSASAARSDCWVTSKVRLLPIGEEIVGRPVGTGKAAS